MHPHSFNVPAPLLLSVVRPSLSCSPPPHHTHTHHTSPLPSLTCGAGRRCRHAHVDSRTEVRAGHADRCSGFAQPQGGGQGGGILYGERGAGGE